jgi:hypothetical protein
MNYINHIFELQNFFWLNDSTDLQKQYNHQWYQAYAPAQKTTDFEIRS